MSSPIRAVRPMTFISATGAAVLLALAVAPAASAATIHACVSRKSGATRIVGAKAKCRHGENRLSWSSSGPAGPQGVPGATGAAGAAGANGVGIDFASSKSGEEPVPLASGAEDVIASETLPAGSYFVSSNSTLLALKATKAGVLVAVACGIADSAGTPSIKKPNETIDESVWFQELFKSGAEYEAVAGMGLQGQLTTTAPTTLALICEGLEGATEATIELFDPRLSALQTTANE